VAISFFGTGNCSEKFKTLKKLFPLYVANALPLLKINSIEMYLSFLFFVYKEV
jgi:hypothetical protein